MTKQNQQADGEIHEDQLLNFLVNALTGAFGVSLAENAEINPEDIYEVLVGAAADGTSISMLCDRSEDSPSSTDILYHLRTKFDLDTVKAVGNTLLQEYTLELLLSRWKSSWISTCDPTTATETKQTVSITTKRKMEPPHSMPMLHCTPA